MLHSYFGKVPGSIAVSLDLDWLALNAGSAIFGLSIESKMCFLVQDLWPHRNYHNVLSSLNSWWLQHYTPYLWLLCLEFRHFWRLARQVCGFSGSGQVGGQLQLAGPGSINVSEFTGQQPIPGLAQAAAKSTPLSWWPGRAALSSLFVARGIIRSLCKL